MKSSIFTIFFFATILAACSDNSILELPQINNDNITTRTAGDGLYDVLGYGYDITEEYMGENSTRLKILNIDAFVQDNRDRFDNPFIGVINQNIQAGEDVYSFLNTMSHDSNFSGSVAKIGNTDEKGYFTGTIKNGFKSNTRFSYSSIFSFAKAEVLKKQRKYSLNTDLATLSRYLSPSFLEDINKYSADKIIAMYGTHVLTNITVGGKYTAYYRSVILNETNHTEKTKTVSAGVKYNFNKIGLDISGSWNTTEITETNRKNTNWECNIKSIGGSTSGTTITLTPTSTSVAINLGAWTESVDDKHSKLIDVDWNATYPIYELISDPIKRNELKDAAIRYINNKKIKVIPLVPLYQYHENGNFHYNCATYSLGWERQGVTCYVLGQKGTENVFPLYQFSDGAGKFHYNTNTHSEIGWRNDGVVCHVYKSKIYDELIPLYQFTDGRNNYHYNTHVYAMGWINQGTICYVFY